MWKWVGGIILVGAIGFYVLSAPKPTKLSPEFANSTGDAGAGARIFAATGCLSCHITPDTETADMQLGGGRPFPSPFGTFYAPNISPSPEGIGDWSEAEFAIALKSGIGKDSKHLYPVLPYMSYQFMREEDIIDLYAFIMTLPVVDTMPPPHDLPFYARWRRPLGIWKRLANYKLPDNLGALTAQNNGAYLVEAMSHCSECHTPRDVFGFKSGTAWLAGATLFGTDEKAPSLRADNLGAWSDDELKTYLQTGFTPDYDTASGEMVEVINNLGQLPDEDIDDIIRYLREFENLE